MNKSRSQPQLTSKDALDSNWLENQPENQQIKQFKVVIRNLPYIQKHNWPNKGVQSLSNLECIIENSLETDQEFVNNNDSVDYIQQNGKINQIDQFRRSTELNKQLNEESNAIYKISNLKTSLNRHYNDSIEHNADQNITSNLNKTTNGNYQSNNLYSKKLNKKSNYKQINTIDDQSNDNSNFFFGPPNLDYER